MAIPIDLHNASRGANAELQSHRRLQYQVRIVSAYPGLWSWSRSNKTRLYVTEIWP